MANNSTARFGHQSQEAAFREGRKWRARQDEATQARTCDNGFCPVNHGRVCECHVRFADLPPV